MMSKKDILEALNLDTGSERFWTGLLAGVGIGALLGGVVALLLAPSSGSELRQSIKDKGRHLVDRVRHREATLGAESEIAPGTVSP